MTTLDDLIQRADEDVRTHGKALSVLVADLCRYLREREEQEGAKKEAQDRVPGSWWDHQRDRERRTMEILGAGNFENCDHAAERVVKERDQLRTDLLNARQAAALSNEAAEKLRVERDDAVARFKHAVLAEIDDYRTNLTDDGSGAKFLAGEREACDVLHDNIDALDVGGDDYTDPIAALQEEVGARDDDCDSLEKEIGRLTAALEERTRERDEALTQVTNLSSELRERHARLRAALAAMTKERDEWHADATRSTADAHAACADVAKADAALCALRVQLEQARIETLQAYEACAKECEGMCGCAQALAGEMLRAAANNIRALARARETAAKEGTNG